MPWSTDEFHDKGLLIGRSRDNTQMGYVDMDGYGGFLKWWVSPTTMGFRTKNDHCGVFWGYHHFRKHPYRLHYTQKHQLELRLKQSRQTISP